MVLAVALALSSLFASAIGSPAVPLSSTPAPPSTVDLLACQTIASKISSAGAVFYPGSAAYVNDTAKWAPNSAQQAVCTVEPGNAQDVSTIVTLLGTTFNTTEFNVKGGGHTCNVGFSSTTGVLISMRRIDSVSYDKAAGTVSIGAGNIWDNVYGALDGLGVSVLGGRISGVGVAGFLLGGGYSWFAQRHGIAMDTIVAYELVIPSGQIVNVTATENPDFFFGLKGGHLNFGVVTNFVMTAVPVGQVWGGIITWNQTYVPAALAALQNFSAHNTDPDAQLVFAYVGINGTAEISNMIFYNGPKPGATFDQFLAIPAANSNAGTKSFLELFNEVSTTYSNPTHQRTIIGSPRVQELSATVLSEIESQIALYTAGAKKVSDDYQLSIAIEPFIESDLVVKNASSTAWPHSTFISPLAILASWNTASEDAAGTAAEQAFRTALEQAAAADGQTPADELFAYPNYSTVDIPLVQMYGPNLPRLQSIAAKNDPHGLLKRAGGFRFQ